MALCGGVTSAISCPSAKALIARLNQRIILIFLAFIWIAFIFPLQFTRVLKMLPPSFITPYNAIALSLLIGSSAFAFVQLQMFIDRKNRAARRMERLYREQYEASGSHTENHLWIVRMGRDKGLDENQLGVLDARLLGQVKQAIAQAVFCRQRALSLIVTAIVVPLVAGFVSAASGSLPAGKMQTIALLCVAFLSAVVSIAQGLLALLGYQKTWFESRNIVQMVTCEIYNFLGNAAPYNALSVDAGFEVMLTKCQGHISMAQNAITQLIEAGARAAEETKDKKHGDDDESERADREPLRKFETQKDAPANA
jgi:hypothetical protein